MQTTATKTASLVLYESSRLTEKGEMFVLSAQLHHCAIVGVGEMQFPVIGKAKLLDM